MKLLTLLLFTLFFLNECNNDTSESTETQESNTVKNIDSTANDTIEMSLGDALLKLKFKYDDVKPRYLSYHVIIGSFKDSNIAYKLEQKLKGKHPYAKIFEVAGWYRVAICSFVNEELALRYSENLQKKYKGAWIYEKELPIPDDSLFVKTDSNSVL